MSFFGFSIFQQQSPTEQFYTPPEDLPVSNSPNEPDAQTEYHSPQGRIILPTDLDNDELGAECGICFEPLTGAPSTAGGRLVRNVVVSTHCACTRELTLFHEYCLGNWAVRQHYVDERTHEVSILCPHARHEVDIGCLSRVFRRVFGSEDQSSVYGSARSHPSSDTDSSKSKYSGYDKDGKSKVLDADDQSQLLDDGSCSKRSESSFGTLPPKVQEVRDMMEHFGEERVHYYGKHGELHRMYQEFGNPKDGLRNWKIERMRRIDDNFGEHGEVGDGDASVLLDPSLFGDDLDPVLDFQHSEVDGGSEITDPSASAADTAYQADVESMTTTEGAQSSDETFFEKGSPSSMIAHASGSPQTLS